MSLFSPPVVEALNRYCVPFHINVDPPDLASRQEADRLRAWVAERHPDLQPLLATSADIGPYLLSPEGVPVASARSLAGLAGLIEDTARRQGVRAAPPGNEPRRYQKEPPALASGALLLRTTSRFLRPRELETRVDYHLPRPPEWFLPLSTKRVSAAYVQDIFQTRLASPTLEWQVLSPEMQAAMIPEGTPRAWDVPEEVARELLWLFRPSTHQFRVHREDVREAKLSAVAREERNGILRVDLRGAARVAQYWFPTSGEGMWLGDRMRQDYWAESQVVGYADLDLRARRVVALRLTTDPGLYRGVDDTQLPFGAILYSVREPAEGLPLGAPGCQP